MGCTGVQIQVVGNATKSANEDDGVVGAAGTLVDSEAAVGGTLGGGEAAVGGTLGGGEAVVVGRVRELEVIE